MFSKIIKGNGEGNIGSILSYVYYMIWKR